MYPTVNPTSKLRGLPIVATVCSVYGLGNKRGLSGRRLYVRRLQYKYKRDDFKQALLSANCHQSLNGLHTLRPSIAGEKRQQSFDMPVCPSVPTGIHFFTQQGSHADSFFLRVPNIQSVVEVSSYIARHDIT